MNLHFKKQDFARLRDEMVEKAVFRRGVPGFSASDRGRPDNLAAIHRCIHDGSIFCARDGLMIRVNGRTGAARARSDSSRSKAIGRTPRLIQINTQTWLRLKLG
jgi:hypothetical protein